MPNESPFGIIEKKIGPEGMSCIGCMGFTIAICFLMWVSLILYVEVQRRRVPSPKIAATNSVPIVTTNSAPVNP